MCLGEIKVMTPTKEMPCPAYVAPSKRNSEILEVTAKRMTWKR